MSRKKKIVPKLRFEDFENHPDWSLTELRNLSTLITKGTTPKDKSGKGSINFIKVENIDKESGEITSVSKVSSAEHNGYLKRSKLYEDDILFSIAGTLGRIATVDKRILPANTNQALAIIRLNEGNFDYIKTYLKGKSIIDYIKNNPTVGAQPNLSLEQVGNFKVTFPTEYEQEKIGSFFKKIDKMIQLQQSKVKKVKDIKSAYLSEMFPKEGEKYPMRRFEGFREPWKIKRISDQTSFRRGSFPQPYGRKEWYDGEKSMPFVQVVDVDKNLKLMDKTKQKISKVAQSKSVFVPEGTVVVTLQGSIGRVAITQYDSYLDRTLLIFEKYTKLTDKYFWAHIIQKKFEEEKQKAPGGTIKTITIEALSSFEISLPSFREQEKIGQFFKKLDNLVLIEEEKLAKLEKLKQAYLNDMFV